MFQYVSIKRRQCTEHRTQGVHRGCTHGCSLSGHASYDLAATIYFNVSQRLQCRSFSVLSCCEAGFYFLNCQCL
jgi:hypothetical protein